MTGNTIAKNKKVENFKYLQVSPRDKTWGLAVTTVGFQHVHPGETYPLSSHPDGYNFPEPLYAGLSKRTEKGDWVTCHFKQPLVPREQTQGTERVSACIHHTRLGLLRERIMFKDKN